MGHACVSQEWRRIIGGDDRPLPELQVDVRTVSGLATGPCLVLNGVFGDAVSLFCCHKGRYRISFDGCPDVILSSGDLIVFYPRHVTTLAALDFYNRFSHAVFEGRDVATYFDRLGFYDGAIGVASDRFERILEQARAVMSLHDSRDAERRQRLAAMPDDLRALAQELRASRHPLVYDAERHLAGALRRGALAPDALSAALGTDRAHLEQAVSAAGRGTLPDVIDARRLRYVRDLLMYSDMPPDEIAATLGFGTSARLADYVRRLTGQTFEQIRQSAPERPHRSVRRTISQHSNNHKGTSK